LKAFFSSVEKAQGTIKGSSNRYL